MSLRLEMLQVSRLAPRLLGESADLVGDFILGQLTEAGGFADREGKPDLYYTVFALNCLEALRLEIPRARIEPYLRSFDDGDGLDLVHLTCLARAWAAMQAGPQEAVRAAMLERLGRLSDCLICDEDGGSLTDRFLVFGAYQDLGAPPPPTPRTFLDSLVAEDGGYKNAPAAEVGSTPATVAAITLLAAERRPIPPRAVRWLEARHSVHGGFTAAPAIAMPDLLSTAVVLHALTAAERPLTRYVEPCLDFIDTLWTNRGAFHGHWAEDEVDCEYTFYGLLSLGHLSVWCD